MKTIAHLASALVLAVSTLVPCAALAADKPATDTAHRHPLHASFPVNAESFRKIMEQRVAGFRARVEKEMGKANLPAEKRAEVRKEVDGAAADIKKEIDKISADGLVSREEAREMKELTNKLRSRIEKDLPRDKRAKAAKRPAHRRAKS